MFSRNIKLYIYPANHKDNPKELYSCRNFELPEHLVDLFNYLLANDKIENIRNFDRNILHILSDDVIKLIRAGEEGWESMVPEGVTKTIKERLLFGYVAKPETPKEPHENGKFLEAWNRLTTQN